MLRKTTEGTHVKHSNGAFLKHEIELRAFMLLHMYNIHVYYTLCIREMIIIRKKYSEFIYNSSFQILNRLIISLDYEIVVILTFFKLY